MTAATHGADIPATVLTINVGSSSIRFAFFCDGSAPKRALSGHVDRIGLPGTVLNCKDAAGQTQSKAFPSSPPAEVTRALLDWFKASADFGAVGIVAHRVVHGGPKYHEPQRVTAELLDELHRITSMDPDHLPAEIEMIQAVQSRFPGLPQIVCFDTAFHAQMPRVAKLLPIPRRYDAMGVQRYGFHGLSYTFLLDELRRLDGAQVAGGRVRKWIGGFAGALGGLDTLVFAGGIGENAPTVRARICEGLGFLGLHLDGALNTINSPLISRADSRVNVRVIPS